MEPVSVAVLMALAGGAGGAAGQHAWTGLVQLARRAFHRSDEPDNAGEPQLLIALRQAPDEERAQALITALTARAAEDPSFAQALAAWRQDAAAAIAQVGQGSVHTSISGGQQNAVITGRDFSGPFTIGLPMPPPSTGEQPSPRQE